MIHYKVVTNHTILFLERDVNKYLNDGYLPHGSVTFLDDLRIYAQVVLKDDTEEEPAD
jgi:hypothetical protein